MKKEFHPENNLTNSLEDTRRMIRDTKERIFQLEQRINQAKSGVRLPENESTEALRQELDSTTRTLENLQDDEAKILGQMAHEDDVLSDIGKQFEDGN